MPYPVAAVRGKNFGSQAYSAKVLSIQSTNLIGYWPLNEASGTNADNAEGTAARDGTYNSDVSTWPVGTGIGDSNTAPVFDGANDYVSIDTASLISAFSGAAGTVLVWDKISTAVWEGGNALRLIELFADNDNHVRLGKTTNNNEIQYLYRAQGTSEQTLLTSISRTDFFSIAITWDKSDNAMKAYYAGSQTGSTQTIAGTWAGSLATLLIGSRTDAGANYWAGGGAHVAIWTKALTAGEVANLGTV